MTPDVLVAIVVPVGSVALGGIAWAAQLERKVSSLGVTVTERTAQMLERHEEVKERLVRIEQKLDALGGSHSR